jgi:hypothetical protein
MSNRIKSIAPQVDALLKHLLTRKTISQAEAGLLYKIRALPRRIVDLKLILESDPKYKGYEITTELKKDPTGQRYARYTLVKTEPKQTYEPVEAPITALNVKPTVGDRIIVVKPELTFGDYSKGSTGKVLRQDSSKGNYFAVHFDHNKPGTFSGVWAHEMEVIAND